MRAIALSVNFHMNTHRRKTKFAVRTLLIASALVASSLIFWGYGKVQWRDWAIGPTVFIVIFWFYMFREDLINRYVEEESKYIELSDDRLKLVDPTKNYEGVIRYKDVELARVFLKEDEVHKIVFFISNGQRIVVSGYSGLDRTAEGLSKYIKLKN